MTLADLVITDVETTISTYNLDITIPKSAVIDEYNKVLKLMQKNEKMKGFRPGKVPLSLIEKKHKDILHKTVSANLKNNAMRLVIESDNYRAFESPSVKWEAPFVRDHKFQFKISFDKYPEYELPSLDGITVTDEKIEVTVDESAEAMENLRMKHAMFIDPEDGLITKECDVEVDITTKNVVDVIGKEESQSYTILNSNSTFIKLADDTRYPGLYLALEGHKVDDVVDAIITFPDDYDFEDLQGKMVKMQFKIKQVKILTLPELNDEFAKKFDKENLIALTTEIDSIIFDQKKEVLEQKQHKEIIDQLLNRFEILLPPTRLAKTIESFTKHLEDENKKLSSEEQLTPAEINRQAEEDAIQNLRRGFLIHGLVEDREITTSSDDMIAHITKMAKRANVPPAQLIQQINPNVFKELESVLREQKLLNTLLTEITKPDTVVHVDEVPFYKENSDTEEKTLVGDIVS